MPQVLWQTLLYLEVCSKILQQSHNGNTTHLESSLFSPRCAPDFFCFFSHQQRQISKGSPVQSSHTRAQLQPPGLVFARHERHTRTTESTLPARLQKQLLQIPCWSCNFFLSGPTLHLVCPHLYTYAPSSHMQPKYLTPGCPFSTQTKLHSTWSVGTAHAPSPNL